MRIRWAALVLVAALVGCGSAPPPASPPSVSAAPAAPKVDVAENDEPPPPIATIDAAERTRPASTASYEEALAVPEPIDIEDASPHLTDVQLWSPMRGAFQGCRVPKYAKVTIRTAVQYGRAIGVTVDVHMARGKRRPTTAERKAIAKMAACVDHNVRAIVWPPNRRRDSFTTEM